MKQAQMQAIEEAKKEKRITKEQLLTELKAAAGDYFVAQTALTEDGLFFRFPNGQEFIIQVNER